MRTRGGKILSQKEYWIPKTGQLQPSLQLRGSTIYAWMRNKERGPVLMSTLSLTRYARFSSPIKTNLPNPNAAVDTVMTDSGEFLMAYNHSSRGRSPLSLAISRDGIMFRKVVDLGSDGGASYAYPALIRTDDGKYHLTYSHAQGGVKTIRYISFTTEWLGER